MSGPYARRALRGSGWTRAELPRLALSIALAGGAAAAAAALLATSGYLISRAAQRPEILALMVAIVAVRGLGIARSVLRYAERLVSHDLALRRLARLRSRFYEVLVPLVPGSLQATGGDLLSRFVADVDSLMDLDLRFAIPAVVALLVLAGASLAAAIILTSAGLVVLAALGLSALLVPWLASLAFARSARRQAPARALLTSELVEALDGAVELALAGRSLDQAGRIAAGDEALARVARSDALASAATAAAGGVIAAAGVIALLLVGIPAVRSGALPGVLLAALVFLLLAAQESMQPLPMAARALRRCSSAASRLQELSGARDVVADPPRPAETPAGGALTLDGVGYAYPGGEGRVLDHARLIIEPGEHVALIGDSGAGKSTIAELLARFRDPQAGSVAIGGVDVRELSQEGVRAAVLLCSQDCHVFNTSIRENLLLGARGASDGRVHEVLGAVELDQWVRSLPLGLDTLVGQDGELVSGGQRTRIALARALLSEARFLVLDEPTAHLDGPLARRVMRSVMGLCAGRAVLAITHDPELLGEFGRVVRLHGGVIGEVQPPAASAAA